MAERAAAGEEEAPLVRIEHLENVIRIGSGVEEIPDIESLQPFVAVELLIVCVSDAIELCKRNPNKLAIIQVPNYTVRLAAELMLNEVSMFEEAACRVTVEMATVH